MPSDIWFAQHHHRSFLMQQMGVNTQVDIINVRQNERP